MITLIVLGAIVLIIAMTLIGIYNRAVTLRNNRENAFADIDVQLKQRHDLIPQLVSVVSGYAKHENETLTRVIEARGGAMQAKSIDEKILAENKLTFALAGFRSLEEQYPELKADAMFSKLQDEISDVENKLSAVRRYFNSATREYNNAIETFPANLVAKTFGFHREIMFEIPEEQRAEHDKAPEIKF